MTIETPPSSQLKPQPQPQPQQAQQSPTLIKQFNNFLKTTAGFEKTLRLVQALAQIVAEVSSHDVVTAARWSTAKSQLALTRRYFRFFNFIECFERVYGLLLGGAHDQGAVIAAIELGKWSALGIYIILEDLTILHAMDIYPVVWNNKVTTEAFKFWFYGLFLSFLGAVWSTLFQSRNTASKNNTSKEKGQQQPPVFSTAHMKRIIVDGCDLLTPGQFLGWIGVGNEVVGMSMVLSTVISGREVWARAQ